MIEPAHTADIISCDQEPIHVPGAILPHGAMLVMDPTTLEILQCAGDTDGLLGVGNAGLLGQTADAVFAPLQAALLRDLSAKHSLDRPRHLLDPILRVSADRPLDASLHRVADVLILEVEEADLSDRFAADPLAAVQDMVQGFDAAPSLRNLCELAADRVRDIAVYDRVLVYRFLQDDSGWVIAESRQPHLEPFLDLHYPAADIPSQARELYKKNWLRLITQVNYDSAPLTPQRNPRTGALLDMTHAVLRDVSPVHRQYLRNMGIDASMSISIICGGRLWGLIACHNYSPRRLPRHVRAICELFGSIFSLQLEVQEKSEQFESRLVSRTVLQNLLLNLASADDYADGLTKESPNLLDYIHIGEPALDGTRLCGVAVCVKGNQTSLGLTPEPAQIAALVEWLDSQVPSTDGVFSTDRLGEIWAPAIAHRAIAAGILAVAVSHDPSDYIIWFRPEFIANVQWAGQPTKLLTPAPPGSRLSPRKSFEVWREMVVGRCVPWTQADRDAAFDLRVSLLHVVLRRIEEAARVRRRAAQRDKLLMAELDHRVKNTLANIQALMSQTSESAESVTGFVEGLDGRIRAMAKAHSLLSESRWEGVFLEQLLREELEPYERRDHSVKLEGARIFLTPKSALSLSLAIHELATNAAKYGSFSRPGGRVAVTWNVGDEGELDLIWRETDGPPVEPPTRFGFGSTLIERALAMETDGHAVLHYPPTGVVCEISLPSTSMSTAEDVNHAAHAVVEKLPLVNTANTVEAFRVLVVEDSFLLFSALQSNFKRLGWTLVGPATRVADALLLANTETFDAALLDINLDGEMSWPVALMLKSRGVPMVLSTAYDVGALLPEPLAGTVVLSKPYRAEDLEARLRQVIAAAGAGS